MSNIKDIQKQYLSNISAAMTWFLVWWTGSLLVVVVVSSQLPIDVLEVDWIMSLSKITPGINVWAEALKETPVMRVVWIYMTLTAPLAISYMLYTCKPMLLLQIEASLPRLFLPTVINALVYFYMISPMTILGESFGRRMFSGPMHDSLPTLGSRVMLGSFFGGIFASWLAAVAFFTLTLILVLSFLRLLTPVINGVTHGIRKQ